MNLSSDFFSTKMMKALGVARDELLMACSRFRQISIANNALVCNGKVGVVAIEAEDY